MSVRDLLIQYNHVLRLSKEAETLEDRRELKKIASELLEELNNAEANSITI